MSAKALLEKKLQETTNTWEERFKQLQTERDAEAALRTKEREYNDLVDYRTAQLQANANDIAPQFHNFITGDNKEQIDNAIAQAKVATQSIADEVAQARQQQAAQVRGVAPTGYTALGPLDGAVGQKTYTPEDINNMTMAEYTKFRQESGLAGNDAARSRGLFG
jgi:Tfp pilus assembly protein PilX